MSSCATSRSSRFTGKGVRSSAEPLAKRFARRGLRGFTLVELMISIAIVLILMLGVNEVFRLTSSTVAAGQSLSTALRDQRALRQVMEEDFNRAAADPQVMVITNQAVAAFRTREDELAQAGLTVGGTAAVSGVPFASDPTYIDLNRDGDADDVGERISPATPGNRIYRTDTITFFTRSTARRQTGNLDQAGNAYDLVGTSTSGESLVSYGHLRVPDNSGTQYFDPGEPDNRNSGSGAIVRRNDNNRYASQWILGRRQMLLVDPPSPTGRLSRNETAWYDTGTLDTTATNYGTQSSIGGRSLVTTPPNSTTRLDLTPLSMVGARLFNPNSNSAVATAGTTFRPHDGRIDVAVTSIAEFARRLTAYEQDVAANPTRYATGGNGDTGSVGSTGLWYLPARSPEDYPEPTLAYGTAPYGTAAPETIVYRGKANPFGSRGSKNELADTLAKTAPILVPRCTQFIVEYAGDFVTQDNDPASRTYGLVTAYGADGEVDFTLEQLDEPRPGETIQAGAAYAGVKSSEPRKHVTKRVRWYGLPRYVGSGNVQRSNTTPGGYIGPIVRGSPDPSTPLVGLTKYDPTSGTSPVVARVRDTTTMPDVVPLSDVLAGLAWNTSGTPAAPYGTSTNPVRHVVSPSVTMAAPFEKIVMSNQTLANASGVPQTFFRLENNANTTTGVLNPVNFLPPQQNYADPDQFPLQRANYVVAWNGGGPRLVRITMTLEDPSGRGNPGGQTFEFVFTPSQLAR